jgi:hypothetical protein
VGLGAHSHANESSTGAHVFEQILGRFRPDPVRRRVEASLQRGTGLHRGEWLLAAEDIDAQTAARVSDDILEWCRERMSAMRRPYGIDQMALAVACAEPGSVPLASQTFGVFRPADFYREDGVAERVSAFVSGIDLSSAAGFEQGLRFAAALFSWGDVAREAVFGDEDTSRAS